MAILQDLLRDNAIVNFPSGIGPETRSGSGTTGDQQFGLSTAADPQTFVYNAALILIWALGVLAVITFIYAGVRYVTAGGDAEKAESAKKIIIGSVIGMLLVMGSYLIFNNAVDALNTSTGSPDSQVLEKIYQPQP